MLDGTLASLRQRALDATDASGYFPAMYARVTQRVQADAAAGGFQDDTRMAHFVSSFADRYLEAVSRPDDAPRCWRAAAAVAGNGRLLVVQHLLIGINAHVNFDLPQTAVALADAGASLASIKPDFDAVNDILGRTYHDIVRDLDGVTRWVGALGALGGGRLFRFSLERARAQAWAAAVRLKGETDDARTADVALLDELTAVLAYLVTEPVIPVRWAVPLLRRLEEDDPRRVTAALLGALA